MADENEEFEFRLRAERETKTSISAPEVKEPDPSLSGRFGAIRGIASDVVAGTLKQAIAVPKHLEALITRPLFPERPEDKKPGLTEKLQEQIKTPPPTAEQNYLLGKAQPVLGPLAKLGESVRSGSEKLIGKEATDVGSDVLAFGGLKGLGTASTGARALRAAESTQSRVTRIIDNLGGGASLEKADVGQVAQKSVGATIEAERKAGSAAYADLNTVMGKDTVVPLSSSSVSGQKYASRVVVDPTVKAFANKLEQSRAMRFEDLQDLRTQIGDAMGSDRNVNRQLRALRGEVTRDIENKAKQLSPDAKIKWDIANSRWHEYVKNEERINRVLGKNWEGKTGVELYQKLFTAATTDPQKIARVMGSITDPSVRRQFAASVLHHMSDVGGEFNGDKFVGQWNRMNPQARKAIFDSVGQNYVQNMDKLIYNLKRIREGHSRLRLEFYGLGVSTMLALLFPGLREIIGGITVAREAYKFGPNTIEAFLTSPPKVRKAAEATAALLEHGTGAGVVATQQSNTLDSLKNAQ